MTIHLPEDLENSLRAEVTRGRFASLDEALAEAARLLLKQSRPPLQATAETSVFDVLDRLGLIGCLEGSPDSPTDLSTNPSHMEGFGRD
jgi:Arc/MetJ-type ribon-helix-helix transcriptional regulator